MYRKIMDFLETWKESEHRKPLILQGARQVGKTYSILEFGRTHYENVAYFNFETDPKLNETFEENISPDYLIPILSHIAGQTIVKEKTLIVFDEVQLCERALTSLKYFNESAPDYHIIVAGSLLGVAVNREKFSFPVGKVDMRTLYPMDMEEFMIAMGEGDLVQQIKRCFATDQPMPAALHDAAMHGVARGEATKRVALHAILLVDGARDAVAIHIAADENGNEIGFFGCHKCSSFKRWFAESLCDYTPHWALPSHLKKERTNDPGARFLRIASLSKKRDSKTALLYA